MPQFSPGDSKTAIAPITVKPTGLSAQAELFLGPNDITKVATSGLKPFTSTGAQQNVSLPVTMPSSPGTYHVYLDVYAGGMPLAGFIADEDVVIAAPAFTFSNLRVSRLRCQTATAWNTMDFWCTITNPTDRTITHILTPMYRYQGKTGYSDPIAVPLYAREITLGPGQSYEYYLPGNQANRCTILLGFSAGVPYGGCAFLRDENGNDSPQVCI